MIMRNIIFIILLFPLLCSAQMRIDSLNIDSITTYKIDEVVIEAAKQYAIGNGIASVPTKKIKQHSINVVDMLSKMMVPGLRVDMMGNKVETTYKAGVHFFIDGVEAQDWEVKALKPKDVMRIEFLQSPADPKFKNYSAVVDFIMKKYDYGGYVLAEGNQSLVYNSGNYGAITKINHKKWTYQALAEVYFRNADDIINRQYTKYVFSPDEVVNKLMAQNQKERTQTYTAAFTTRYDSKKFNFSISAGYRYKQTPENSSKNSITYIRNGEAREETEGEAYASSRNASPYLNTYFQVSNLPNNSLLYGAASVSYNHRNTSDTYVLDTPIFNSAKEDAWLPRVWLAYAFPLYKKNYMSFSADWTSEIYKTHYSGTNNSFQKLINNYLYIRGNYNHSFSEKWSAGASFEIPINSYKVNDGKYNTTPYFNGSITANGRINQKHSIYAKVQLSQMMITPNYYNSVVRQDNEIEGSKGNSDLKTQRYLYSVISYSWMPTKIFSLNASLNWEQIMDDIVPYWHPIDGLMVKDMINSGNYNGYSASISPSFSLFKGKLNIQPMLYFAHETVSGLLDISVNNFGFYPSISYIFNKHFSASANYTKGLKGYMRGGNSNLSQASDNLKIAVQYTTGNFFALFSINSVCRKNGWWKSWFDSANYNNYEYLSRPWDSRYVNLTMRYTLDFGRKTKHGNDARFEGNVKSSIL